MSRYRNAIKTNREQFDDLVATWEEGLELVATIESHEKGCEIHVCKGMIGTDDADRYFVLRYFSINYEWCVSCDANGVRADEAFKAIARVLS